jgi:hypothetical protein
MLTETPSAFVVVQVNVTWIVVDAFGHTAGLGVTANEMICGALDTVVVVVEDVVDEDVVLVEVEDVLDVVVVAALSSPSPDSKSAMTTPRMITPSAASAPQSHLRWSPSSPSGPPPYGPPGSSGGPTGGTTTVGS